MMEKLFGAFTLLTPLVWTILLQYESNALLTGKFLWFMAYDYIDL